jgi:large subunit ribosomal protein L10
VPTPRKSAEIDLLEQKLRDSGATIVTDYRGLSVAEIGQLRALLRPSGVEFRVAKNTLTLIAAKRAGVVGLDDLLVGPTAIAFAGDDVATAAKVLGDFARTSRILTIKGALMGGLRMNPDQVGQLAALPSKPVLQATLAGTIQAPLAGFVGLLNGALSGLVYTLEGRAEQLQAAA